MSALLPLRAFAASLALAGCGGLVEVDPAPDDHVRLGPPRPEPCERDAEAVPWFFGADGACRWADTDNPGNEYFGLGRLNHRLMVDGVASDLWFVGGPEGCAGDPHGWYHDLDDDEHRLCPAACDALVRGEGARLERVVGCPMRVR